MPLQKSLIETKSESLYHKIIKQLVYKSITEKSLNIENSSTEKYLKNHRADVYFKLKNGKNIVVEIQNSKISVREITKRTSEYNQQGIYVLWILNSNGKCAASAKNPEHRKNVKISPVEKFLHKIYGGRVYYVKVNESKEKITVTPPFALHYSLSDTKPWKSHYHNYSYYYYRNSNFTFIPNWNLFCTEFNDYKIARFYDKNLKLVLKDRILEFIDRIFKNHQKDFKKYRNAKKIIKHIISNFNNQHGKHLIIECIDLINKKMTLLNEKAVAKFNRNS